jgi:PKD repeat protein
VRHKDFRGVWSPWSEETSFTTTKGELYFTYTPQKPIVGEIIAFTAPTYGWIVSYEWDFDDGERGCGQTVDHSYREAKDYNVT